MPTYQYKCENEPEDTNHKYEHTRNMTDPELEPEKLICKVEGCGGKLERIFTAPPIQFKGMGFSTGKSWR